MKNHLNKYVLHLSTMALWDLGKGKGRASTYLPLKGMVDAGYKVLFLTSCNTQQSCVEAGIDVRHISVPINGTRIYIQLFLFPLIVILFIMNGLWYCKRNKPSVIYAHATILALPAYILSKMFRAKYVLRLYGIGKGLNKPFCPSGILLRIAFKLKADSYIFTNDGTNAKEFAISCGVDTNKIHFLRNGINKDVDFHIDKNLRKDLAPNGEIVLLSVSRLVNWKHIDDIIRMMVPLKQKQLKFKLVIVGDGPERNNLENLCKQQDLSNYVVFVGALLQEKVFSYNLVSDIFISLNELSSMSNPVFEAMLAGCVVIALNRGNTEEMIQNGNNGILIQTVDQLPDVVCDIISDPQKAAQIGQNAQKYMLDKWPSWTERINEELNILNNLIEQK